MHKTLFFIVKNVIFFLHTKIFVPSIGTIFRGFLSDFINIFASSARYLEYRSPVDFLFSKIFSLFNTNKLFFLMVLLVTRLTAQPLTTTRAVQCLLNFNVFTLIIKCTKNITGYHHNHFYSICNYMLIRLVFNLPGKIFRWFTFLKTGWKMAAVKPGDNNPQWSHNRIGVSRPAAPREMCMLMAAGNRTHSHIFSARSLQQGRTAAVEIGKEIENTIFSRIAVVPGIFWLQGLFILRTLLWRSLRKVVNTYWLICLMRDKVKCWIHYA